MIAFARAMDGSILKVIMIPCLKFWLRYHVAIQTCTYIIYLPTHSEFSVRLPGLQRYDIKVRLQIKFFSTCNHLYFIIFKVSNLDPDFDLSIHAPTFSFNEVKLIIKGASWHILLPRIPLGLVLQCVLMDVAICEPHVYSQLFSIINIISWIFFIPLKMLHYNIQLMPCISLRVEHYMFNLTCLLFSWTLFPVCQPLSCLGLHFISCSWWRWTRLKQINIRYRFILYSVLQWTTMWW